MVSLGGTQPTEWLFGLCISTYNEWFPTIRSLWDFFLRETVAGFQSWILGLLAIFLGGFPIAMLLGFPLHQGLQDSEKLVAILHRFGPGLWDSEQQ